MKRQMKRIFCFKTVITLVLAFTMLMGASSTWAEPWKFGVMSDTQWTITAAPTDPAGQNPNAVSASIIQQINRQFINHGVEFVIQVGDLTENGNDADIAVRAAAAQPLIDAGIGFFPMRGNHETYGSPANNYAIPAFKANFPQTRGLSNTFGATNFSSPTSVSPDLTGMSYSFDYGNHGDSARFLIIDNWVTPSRIFTSLDGYNYGYSIGDQQDWINSRLDKHTRHTKHAFVFSHQPLMAENHQDSPFNGFTNENPDMQNAFFASLQCNDVGYYISGHDHIHQRSIIKSPDTFSSVHEIICASDSSKFYTPKPLDNGNWFGQKVRETSISQERYGVGFYIYIVDGPCVTVDYYSDVHGNWASDNCYPDGTTPQSCTTAGSHITPIFNFVKKETWGYCQNGKEFLVPQGSSYTTVQDSFGGTSARILDGKNNSTARDGSLNTTGGVGRQLIKAVNTGWPDMDGWGKKYPGDKSEPDVDLASNIFRLSGITDLLNNQTDTYALSLSYDHKGSPKKVGDDAFLLVTRDKTGRWVNAVDMNFGGMGEFVAGPYVPGYGLGAYGFDPNTRTAWAVINYNGDFAVACDIE